MKKLNEFEKEMETYDEKDMSSGVVLIYIDEEDVYYRYAFNDDGIHLLSDHSSDSNGISDVHNLVDWIEDQKADYEPLFYEDPIDPYEFYGISERDFI